MQKTLLNCAFIILITGFYSGLALHVTVPVFFGWCLYQLRNNIELNLKPYWLEVIFCIWMVLSSLWSLNPSGTLISSIKTIMALAAGLVVIQNIHKLKINKFEFQNNLLATFALILLLFFIEYFGDGFVSNIFRLYLGGSGNKFMLYHLDRGMSLTLLFGWILIALFLKRENKRLSAALYAAILLVLSLSDNLAALLGHLIAGMVFLLTRFTFLKNPILMVSAFVLLSVAFVIFAQKMDLYKLTQQLDMPFSAKHRLFIWNFVAQHAGSNFWHGIGFGCSRYFPVAEAELIPYHDQKLSPLPLHPHNNLLEVYFELGAIGFFLYLSLMVKYLIQIGRANKQLGTSEKNLIAANYALFAAYFTISMISYSVWQSWWVLCIIWCLSIKTLAYANPKH